MDGASLALFRVAFYLIIAWEVARYFQYDRVHRYYIEPQVLFPYLDVIRPWPGQGMVIHFLALGALALLSAAGLFYRVAAPLCAAALAYFFLLDKAQYLNHLYLCSLLALLLALAPAHRAFSLDRLLCLRRSRRGGPPPPPETVPRGALWLLRLQIALVYFYGGVAKLNADWLAGRPLDQWLPERSHVPLLGPLLLLPEAPLFVAWAGLFIDLSAPFLLLSRRALPWGMALCALFHITNAALFKIGIFPYAMLATLALFPDPSWPRRLLRQPLLSPPPSPSPTEFAPRPSARATRALLATLHAYLLLQLLLPLRHWLYPGDVAWNEAGHRFSWRMKLRDKQIEELEMHVLDPRTGIREQIDLEQWLTPRQIDEMGTRPDMLVDFAHIVAARWEAAAGVRPRVTAWVVVSLNGHPPRPLLDPTLDLAAQPRGLWSPW